jgi:hypothetical protein
MEFNMNLHTNLNYLMKHTIPSDQMQIAIYRKDCWVTFAYTNVQSSKLEDTHFKAALSIFIN